MSVGGRTGGQPNGVIVMFNTQIELRPGFGRYTILRN